jgi:hypothetical protein
MDRVQLQLIDSLYKKVVDRCLSPFNKARFMPITATQPGVPMLPPGYCTTYLIVGRNSYMIPESIMIDSHSNDDNKDPTLGYSSFLFKSCTTS